MVIAQVSTSQSFHKTHRYTALRERSAPPKLLYSSMPEASVHISGDSFPPELPLRLADSMEAQAGISARVEKPCYHIALSVGEDEQLSRSQWHQLATKFQEKAELNADKYQSVAYLHEDTQFPDSDRVRPHVHLIVNRVSSDGRAAPTSWDYYRFQNALRAVEAEMGLSPEPNSWEVDQRRDTPGQVHRLQQDSEVELSVRVQLQQAVDSELKDTQSFDAVVQRLEQQSAIDVRASDRGWSLAQDGVAFAGYQLGRQYTRPAIEKRLEAALDMSDDYFQSSQPSSFDGLEGGMADGFSDQGDQANETATDSDRFGMGYLMRNALGREAQRHGQQSDKVAGLSQDLMGYGQKLGYMSGDTIDGLSVAGLGFTALGAGVGVAKYIGDRLNEAKQNARSKRVQGFVDRLNEISDRSDGIEGRFGGPDFGGNGPGSPGGTPGGGGSLPPGGPGGGSLPPEGPGGGSFPPGGSGGGSLPPGRGLDIGPVEGGSIVSSPGGDLSNTDRPDSTGEEPDILDAEILDGGNGANHARADGFQPTDGSWGSTQASDPVLDVTILAGGRIDQLDMMAGVSPQEPKIQLDPNLPLDQQLDKVDEQITALEERLDLLEERTQDIQTERAAEAVPGAIAAERLANYATARADAYMISPEEPIQTRTMGTIQATSDRVTIDDPNYGNKFDAARTASGEWQVEIDDLSVDERAKISNLPQTTEQYTTQAQGKQVVRSLQELAPREFSRPEGGNLQWKANLANGGSETFEFAINNQADSSQTVSGTNGKGESILEADISPSGVMNISQLDIPTEQIERLAEKTAQANQAKQSQRGQGRQSPQMQL